MLAKEKFTKNETLKNCIYFLEANLMRFYIFFSQQYFIHVQFAGKIAPEIQLILVFTLAKSLIRMHRRLDTANVELQKPIFIT